MTMRILSHMRVNDEGGNEEIKRKVAKLKHKASCRLACICHMKRSGIDAAEGPVLGQAAAGS